MKTRQGFVSNSSSSSFVIKGDNKTTWDVAKDMLRQRYEDAKDMGWGNDGYYSVDPEVRICEIEALNLPVDTPFTMHSSQYETFIFKYDGKILIDTCMNISWDIKGEYVEYMSEEYRKYHDGDGLTIDYKDMLFFHMDYMVIGREPHYSQRPPRTQCQHYTTLKLADGTFICPVCNPPVPITPFPLQITEAVNSLNKLN